MVFRSDVSTKSFNQDSSDSYKSITFSLNTVRVYGTMHPPPRCSFKSLIFSSLVSGAPPSEDRLLSQ